MLRYCQLTVKEVPDTSELIYTVNKAEILKDWTTALPLKIQTPSEPQIPYIHPLNLGQLIKHLTLSDLLYTHATVCIIAKGIISKTKTRAIKTSPLQCPTSHLSPTRTVQGRRLISAPLGRLRRASPAVVPEN